jgi:hypothetical protein
MRSMLIAVLLASVFSGQVTRAERWTGDGSPLDGHRLIVLRPNQFTAAPDSASEVTQVRHKATVSGSAASLKVPLQAPIRVTTRGKYVLWVRIGQSRRYRTPLQAAISSQGKVLAQASIKGAGETGSHGGRDGYLPIAM